MSQTIHCRSCDADTVAANVADLISAHTNEVGRFACSQCGEADTFLKPNARQRRNGGTERWIKSAIPIETKTAGTAHATYVILTADVHDGEVSGMDFK